MLETTERTRLSFLLVQSWWHDTPCGNRFSLNDRCETIQGPLCSLKGLRFQTKVPVYDRGRCVSVLTGSGSYKPPEKDMEDEDKKF